MTGFSYNQSLLEEKMSNTFFSKELHQPSEYPANGFIQHHRVEGCKRDDNQKSIGGYGIGSRYTAIEPLSIKISYEHSVRLPLARELLGNGTTIYANVALKPESSDNVNLGIFGTWHPAPRPYTLL